MATKAIVLIGDPLMDEAGQAVLMLRISVSGQPLYETLYGPFDPGLNDVTLNADIRTFVQTYATDSLNVTFDVGDTVRLVHLVASVPL